MNYKHGGKSGNKASRTYSTWVSMKNRCLNQKSQSFLNYGGRGIKVCERWMTFENFLADMGEKPKELTLERINNSGDYEPGNCRWATWLEQENNRRYNRIITHDGRSLSIAQWSRITGIKACTIWKRLKDGYDGSLAVTLPKQNRWSSKLRRPIHGAEASLHELPHPT